MIKACIFDLDGTLLDTLDDLADSVNLALTKHGYPVRSREDIRAFVGNGVARLVARAVPEGTSKMETAAVLADFRTQYQQQQQQHTTPYPGIVDLLETLTLSGLPLAVLSNKPDPAVADLVTHFFPNVFVATRGESAAYPKKPDPQGLLQLLDQLDVTCDEALYIGDSEVDVYTAKNAKVPMAAALWGFRDEAILLQAGATCLLDEPLSLLNVLFESDRWEG